MAVLSGNAGQESAKFQTSGIDAIAWRRLFLPNEPYDIDELRYNINNPSYVLVNGNSIDDAAVVVGLSISYRKFLGTCFKAFEEATNGGNGIDVNDELVFPSLMCFEALGILSAGRKEEIIKGVPL